MMMMIALAGVCSCVQSPGPVERQMVGLTEKFDRWDENGDGLLSISDLRQAEQISGIPAEKILNFYDTSGDRMISLRESQEAMSKLEEAERLVDQ